MRTLAPRSILCGLCLATAAIPVHAANVTWNAGSSSDWATGGNWSTGSTPNAATMLNTGDSLFFGTSASVTATNDLVTGGTFSGITFNSGAGAITLSGSGIVLGPYLESSGGVLSGGNITNNSSSVETINLPVTLAPGDETISTASGAGALTFSDGITIGNHSIVQFSPGGGAITVSSGLANTNGILGGWATTGTNWATLSGSSVVAYSGYTTEADTGGNWGLSTSGGNASNNLKIATSNNSWAYPNTGVTTGTMDINSLVYSTGTNNGGINLNSGNVLRFGPQGGIMNATPNETFELNNNGANDAITAGGNSANTSGTLTFMDNLSNTANGSQGLIIYTAIDNNGSGPVTVNVVGNVLFQDYGGTENYSGGTNIQAGRTVYGASGSYGTGAISVYPGAEAEFSFGSATISNALNLAGYGTPTSGSGSGGDPMALRTGGNTFSGVVTLTGTATIGINGSATFGGSSGITGPGGLIVTGNYGSGSMHLGSFANTYQGDTVISAAGYGGNTNNQITMWIDSSGNNNVMPHGVSAGNLVLVGGNSSGAFAQFDLGGSTQNVNGLSTQGGGTVQYTNVTSNPSGGTLVVGNNNATSTFGGTIGTYGSNGTQGVSLTKVGTGVLTLSGTSNYTGPTDIENGTLSVTGTLLSTGGVTLDDTTVPGNPILAGNGVVGNVTLPTNNGSDIASISPGATGFGSIGMLKLTSLTMNGGQMLLDLSSTNAAGLTYDTVNVSGTLTLPTSSSAWTITPSLGAAAGVYAVLTSATSNIASGAALPTVNAPGSNPLVRPASYIPSFSGNSLLITVGGGSAAIIWTGTSGSGGNGIWNINTTQNWNDSAATVPTGTFYNGDSVTFNDSGTNPNITISSGTLGETTVAPSSITVSSNTVNYTIGGNPISGVASLAKSGASTLTLTGSNGFTGITSINGGVLNVGNSGALGGGGNITFGGGTLQYSSSNQADYSSEIVNSGSAIIIDTNGQSVSYANGIAASNTGGLIKNGAGMLTLNGVNTYTGNTVINSGTLVLTAGNTAFGALASPDIYVNPGGALVLSNNDTLGYTTGRNVLFITDGLLSNNAPGDRDTIQNQVTMVGGTMSATSTGNLGGAYSWDVTGGGLTATSDASGSAAVISAQTALQLNTTFTVNRGAAVAGNAPDLIVSGIIAEEGGGGNSLTITGSGNGGITVFSGANSFNQATAINNGIVNYQNSTAFGVNSAITVSNGATAQVQGNLTGGTNTLSLSGAGDTALGATGALENVSGANSYSGAISLAANTTISADTGTLTLNGALSGSSSALTIAGSGTVVLTASNTYGGATTVQGGRLVLNGGASINSSLSITVSGSGAKFVQASSAPVGQNVSLVQGTIDGTGVITNTVTVSDLASNTVQNGYGSVAALTIGNLVFNGAGTLNIADSGNAAIPGIDITGALTTGFVNTSGTVTVNVSAPSWTNGVTYDIASFGSLAGAGAGDIAEGTISNLTTRQSAILGVTGSDITITILGDAPKWTALDNNNWTLGGTGANYNWKLISAGTPTNYQLADSVLFDDSASSGLVNISSANVSPTSTTFNNNSLNYTLTSGSGFGIVSGPLVKSGSATVTIDTANSFTGPITINGGALILGNASALGGGQNISFGGGTLEYSSSNQVDYSSQIIGSTGPISINANGQSLTYASGLASSNTGGLILSGNGTLTLAAVNTYTGNTVVNSGTLVLTGTNTGSPGSGDLASPVIDVNAGGALVLTQNDTLGYTSGRNALVINDGLVYNNTSTDRDTLQNSVTMTGGTLAAAGAGNNGGAFSWNVTGGGLTATSDANGSPALISATTAVQTNSIWTVNRGSAVFGFSPDLLVTGAVNQFGIGNSLNITGGGITEFDGAIGFTGTLGVESGIVILTNGAAYGQSSSISIANGATVQTAGSLTGGGNTLTLSGSGDAALGATGALENVSGASSFAGPVVLAGNALISSDAGTLTLRNSTITGSGYNLTVAGDGNAVISDYVNIGSGGITMLGAGQLTLSGDSTYTGVTYLDNGTVNVDVAEKPGVSGPLGESPYSNPGSIVFGGGILQYSFNNQADYSGRFSTAGNQAFNIDTNGESVTYATGLAGNGSTLTLEDSSNFTPGTLTLTGSSTYTGPTTVTNGNLVLSGSGSINGSSGISVNGGGAKFVQASAVPVIPTVSLLAGTIDGTGAISGTVIVADAGFNTVQNGNGGTGILTIGNLDFQGAATVNANDSGVASVPTLIVTGTLTTGDGDAFGTVTVNVADAIGWANDTTYDLINFGSLVALGSESDANFALGTVTNLGVRQSAQLEVTGSDVALVITGDSPKWTGLNNSNWDTVTPNNWQLIISGSATTYMEGDDVLFDDSASSGIVNISSANVNPTLTTFNNNALNYTLTSGSGFGIAGGSLIKNGTGTVTIETPNTYSGPTQVNAGIINYQNGTAFGANSTITVASNATVQVQGNISGGGETLTLSGSGAANATGALENVSGSNSYSGPITLAANSLISSDAGTLTLGAISGAYTLTTTGSGAIALAGGNSYTGATNISNGTLEIQGTLGNTPVNLTGGTLSLQNAGAITQNLLTVNGGALVETVANGISGTAGLTIASGSTTLNQTNNYTGVTDIGNGASLYVSSMANGGANSSIGAASASPANLVLDGGELAWSNSTNGASSNRGFTLTPNGGTLALITGSAVSTTLSGAIAFSGSGARTLTLTGTDGAPLAVASQTLSGNIGDAGPGQPTSVVKTGNNGWVLSGSNTYSGGTTIIGGRIRVQSTNAFGTGAVSVDSGAQAYFATAGTYGNSFTIAGIGINETENGPGASGIGNNGALRIATNNVVLSGSVILAGNSRITARGASGAGGTISGRITDNGGDYSLEFGNSTTSAGVLTLTNANNSWGGGMTVSLGTLKIGAASSATVGVIPHGVGAGNVTINGGDNLGDTTNSTLDLNGFNLWINGLISSGSTAQDVVTNSGSAATLSVGDNNAGGTYAGAITGSINFTKIGSGTETLAGAETYTGLTSVTAGTLAITGSWSGSSGVSVTNATLAGTGSITNGVTIGSGTGGTASAIIEPGGAGKVGTLNLSNALSLNSDGEFVFNLDSTNGGAGNGASELLAANVSLNSNSQFSLVDIATNPGVLTLGTEFTVIQAGGGITGTFGNLPNGGLLYANGNTFEATYSTDSLTLEAVVPEPGSWELLVAGAGLMIGVRRLRRGHW